MREDPSWPRSSSSAAITAGNIVAVVKDGGVTPSCCGEPMELLVAGSTDAATEKHVPVVTKDGNHIKVSVGEVAHP